MHSLLVRRRSARMDGFSLLEIMVVLVIVGAMASAVAVTVMKQARDARIRETKIRARTIQQAAKGYLMDESGDCPTVRDLLDGGHLDTTTDSDDAWGNSFVIDCDDDTIHVHSAGTDEQHNTEDDVGF